MPRGVRLPWILVALVAAGALLRGAILLTAENRLDADESTVGVMALDILEQGARPLFFYGTDYNGGGALEAYLAAPAFAILGASPVVLKGCLLALWLGTALLFADLCRRQLAAGRAAVAVGLFALGTPFLLEWSLKARGGFAETVLVSVALLWIAAPPAWLASRRALQCAAFGAATALGLWASEMVLAMVPCAAAWAIARRRPEERLRFALGLAVAIGIAWTPLGLYNLANDGAQLRRSVLFRLLAGGDDGGAPLGAGQLRLAAAFVLGPAWPLGLLGVAVGALRVARERPLHLGHVLALHTLLYALAFWISGLRYLPVPPSRVLYALAPGLAVLLACAAAGPTGAEGRARTRAAAAALALWAAATLVPVAGWVRSGEPREAGSWRGSWALADGDALREALLAEGTAVVYANYWTAWSLRFADRAARRRDPDAPPLEITWNLPENGSWERGSAALVLNPDTPLARQIEARVAARGLVHRRREADGRRVLAGMAQGRLDQSSGFPAFLGSADWRPPPAEPDGFN